MLSRLLKCHPFKDMSRRYSSSYSYSSAVNNLQRLMVSIIVSTSLAGMRRARGVPLYFLRVAVQRARAQLNPPVRQLGHMLHNSVPVPGFHKRKQNVVSGFGHGQIGGNGGG